MPDLRVQIENRTFELFNAVARAAASLQIRWLITGAMGRVLLLEEVYKLPPGRATQDVDVGVMVESWDHFRALIAVICQDGRFYQDPRQTQRLNSEYGSLDLVPFGGVASDAEVLQWPPDGDFVMSVAGFREACEDSVSVVVNDTLVVQVASPVGLLLLKLLAWEERHIIQPGKDAADIACVLRYGSTLVGEESLYEEYFDLATATGFDLDLAAAGVLGRKLRRLASPSSGEHVQQMLERELTEGIDSRLVREISRSLVPADQGRAFALLSMLRDGLSE